MSQINIHPIDPSMIKKTTKVAIKAFGKGVTTILPKKNVWGFYAEQDDDVLGAVYIKEVAPQEGILEWIFVDPDAHGLSIGKKLAEAGFNAMKDRGLTRQFALVRDDNTASWNLFAKEDYKQVTVLKSLFGYHIKSFTERFLYSLASNYSIWVKDERFEDVPIHPRQFSILKTLGFATWIGASLSLFSLRGVDFFWIALAMVPAVTLVRIIVAYPFARQYGPVRFDAPQGGTPLAVILALLGSWWPTFGYFLPREDYWRDDKFLPYAGKARFASWMSMVAVYIGSSYLFPETFSAGLNGFLITVIVIQLIPFFPLDGMDGNVVFKHSKLLYALGVLISIVAILVY